MIALFILAVVLILLYDGLPLLKKRLWRELSVLGLLLGSAAYLGLAKMLGMSAPPNWLEQLLAPLGKMILK